MIYLKQDIQDYNNDIRPLLMAFYTGEAITEKKEEAESCRLTVTAKFGDEGAEVSLIPTPVILSEATQTMHECAWCRPGEGLRSNRKDPEIESPTIFIPGDWREKETYRNDFKKGVYHLLSDFTGRTLPWGDLTGVRPTKIAMQQLVAGRAKEEIVDYYMETYDTSKAKAELATRVAENERRLVGELDLEQDYCLYIGIPFCKSRCLYCSFTSYPIAKYKKCAADYVEKLIAEVKVIARKNKERNPVAIYIGGGTPASLSEELTERLMCGIEEAYPELPSEYTVEAGRADCITLAKLKSYINHGVNRVSINPQTMNNETLVTIGRAHTAEQVVEAFHLAREAGFTNINMDLIAGLPGEDVKAMEHTLSEIEKLAPESLTVHSLALKRAANLNKEFEAYGGSIHHDMEAQLDLVERSASRMGLEPYYLYRQKNIGGNLENVGYAKPGCACLYNILIMEELVDIMGAGAGAATKLHRKVERIANPKQVEDYFARYDEIIERKENMTWQ